MAQIATYNYPHHWLLQILFYSNHMMKVDTALCFILSAISLWFCLEIKKSSEQNKTSQLRFWGLISTSLIVIIGSFILTEYLVNWNLSNDKFLIGNYLSFSPMALNTALNFMLLGRALQLLIKPKTSRSYWYAHILSLIAALISIGTIIGYFYKVKLFYEFIPYIKSIGLNTALVFAILCGGILSISSDQGLMKVLTRDTHAALLARRLLLVAIVVPLGLGWLILQGERAGLYDSGFAVSLLVIVLIISFSVLIWQNTALVTGISDERDRVKEKLKSFVDANVIGIIFADVERNVYQANDEFLRITGHSREDLKAGKISGRELTPPEYLNLDQQRIAEAVANGACTPYEKEYIRKDNTRVPILIGYSLVGGEKQELVGFILDISDRYQKEQALRESEERFRLAVDNIPDVFAIYDSQRRLQFVNNAGLERVKKTAEEILGHTDEEIFPPDITNNYLPTLIKAQETGKIQTTEATIALEEYGKFTTEIKYVPLLDKKGQIYQILGFTNDITERKEIFQTLQNQQKWLESLLNLMPTPLLLIEPVTARVTFANKAADEAAGGEFPKAESIADYQTYYYSTDVAGNVIPPEQTPGVRLAHGECIQGFELDWHTPIGIRSLLIHGDILPEMHGHPTTCVLVFQDITKVKQVEKALGVNNSRLQLLFETVSELLSSQQPLSLINSLYQKIAAQIDLDVYFNYIFDEKQQTLHLESYSGISPELAKKIEWLQIDQAVCGTTAKQRRQISVENVQQSTDIKTELIRSLGIQAYSAQPLIAQGRLLGTLSFGSRRRTKFSQNEMAMMQAICDQIAIAIEQSRLIVSLQQQTQQLQETNRMKDEFLAVLSHELRSPLNAILGWAQILRSRRQLDEGKKAQALETIERNARAQTQLIEDLLDISRIIRGQLRLNVRSVQLSEIIHSVVNSLRLAADVKDIYIRTIIDRNLQPIFGDPGRLQQIIWNLLSNAIKFTPNRGRVEIRLSMMTSNDGDDSQTFAVITVKDTGIGIKADFLPYIFDRFRQADSSSTRSYGGLGLGLSIVRNLVELHGGTIQVESPGEGQGTTFTVKLPLLKKNELQLDKQTNSNIQPISTSLKGIKVLVVDDEADAREFASIILEQCQANVEVANSVQEALHLMQNWKPDVLVSDIGMPEEDGYSLIRKVRSLPPDQGGNTPAAALTAYTRPEDRLRAIKEGYQLHLSKPVEAAELATVVANLALRRR